MVMVRIQKPQLFNTAWCEHKGNGQAPQTIEFKQYNQYQMQHNGLKLRKTCFEKKFGVKTNQNNK